MQKIIRYPARPRSMHLARFAYYKTTNLQFLNQVQLASGQQLVSTRCLLTHQRLNHPLLWYGPRTIHAPPLACLEPFVMHRHHWWNRWCSIFWSCQLHWPSIQNQEVSMHVVFKLMGLIKHLNIGATLALVAWFITQLTSQVLLWKNGIQTEARSAAS